MAERRKPSTPFDPAKAAQKATAIGPDPNADLQSIFDRFGMVMIGGGFPGGAPKANPLSQDLPPTMKQLIEENMGRLKDEAYKRYLGRFFKGGK